MTVEQFIADVLCAAEKLGCPFNEEAREFLTRSVQRSRDEWEAGGARRGHIKSRARMVVLRAVMSAKGSGLSEVDGRNLRIALADAEASM